jgi:hypothetical protein
MTGRALAIAGLVLLLSAPAAEAGVAVLWMQTMHLVAGYVDSKESIPFGPWPSAAICHRELKRAIRPFLEMPVPSGVTRTHSEDAIQFGFPALNKQVYMAWACLPDWMDPRVPLTGGAEMR